MATLAKPQLAQVARSIAPDDTEVTWSKDTVNAAVQAIEDWFEKTRPQLNMDINVASSPTTFTPGQKQALLAAFLRQKARRE